MLLSTSKLHSLIIKGHPLKSLSLRKCITILWNLLKRAYLGIWGRPIQIQIMRFALINSHLLYVVYDRHMNRFEILYLCLLHILTIFKGCGLSNENMQFPRVAFSQQMKINLTSFKSEVHFYMQSFLNKNDLWFTQEKKLILS